MGIVSSIFGDGGANSNNAALEAIKNVPLPVLKEYYPDLYKQVVSLNPDLESAVSLGPSEMEGIATDPGARQAQLSALAKLQEIGDSNGQDAQFLSDESKIENDVNTNLKGQQDAIMQNLATRGMAGGGSELVQRQLAAQGAANTQASMAMDAKAQAQQRALQALMQSGQLGSQMQQQDFQQASAKAAATDAINKFNTQNQQQIINDNTGIKNAAQQTNATNAQTTANSNTSLNNDAQKYNLGLDQQDFNNKMAKATGVANQYNNIANSQNQERSADMQLIGNLAGAGASAYAGSKK
jgi:hypothetical protein